MEDALIPPTANLAELQKNLEELKTWMESKVDSTYPAIFVGPLCSLGEPYKVLACGVSKEEGSTGSPPATTLNELFEYSKKEFLKYLESVPGIGRSTLHWRTLPVVDEHSEEGDFGTKTWYSLRMRLVVTRG